MKILGKRWVGVLLLVVFSCSKNEYTLDRQDLFKIELGLFEDELDFFDREQRRFNAPIDFIINQGFFYISNSSLGKVMKFSNQGDILSVLYTPRLNIPLAQIWDSGLYAHNFNELERITMDQRGLLYAVDKTFIEKKSFDSVQPRRIIKVFDSQYRYLYFIGKDGVGSGAFGYIHAVGTTTANELVVISREQEDWMVDIYEQSGNLLYSSGALNSELLYDLSGLNLYINDISFSRVSPKVYISVIDFDQEDNVAIIYSYDIENMSLSEPLEITALADFYPYSMLGGDRFGNRYFYSFNFNENYYQIKKYASSSADELTLLDEIRLNLPIDEVVPLLNKLYLDDNGLISTLSLHERYAQVSWWRTDQVGISSQEIS